jgi:hypothetical protein
LCERFRIPLVGIHLIKILWMFRKYCLFSYYFVRLPASEFMVVRSCYNFSFSPRIANGINADCKIGVYAYHWKHKRCTIKMWHEYLSSWISNVFRERRVASNYFSSLFSRVRHHWVAETMAKYKAFQPYFHNIYLGCAWVRREGGRRFIQNGRDFLEFIWFHGEWGGILSLSAYLSSSHFAIPHRKLIIKIRIESF